MDAFFQALSLLERPTSPFVNEVIVPTDPVWVESGIVISVEFKEWARDEHLRVPVYKGIELGDPETVTWDEEGPG